MRRLVMVHTHEKYSFLEPRILEEAANVEGLVRVTPPVSLDGGDVTTMVPTVRVYEYNEKLLDIANELANTALNRRTTGLLMLDLHGKTLEGPYDIALRSIPADAVQH